MSIKEKLAKIVGETNVIDDTETLEAYSKDHSFTPPKMPLLVVRPSSRPEVQKIIRSANKVGFHLIPVSSGPPRFNGDTIPLMDNTVILDLSRMNNIIWINRKNRVCVVEPGVTYGQLQKELKSHGLRVAQPLFPKASKSVISAALERVPNTLPKYHWDVGDPLASTELMLGSSDILWGGEVGFCKGDDEWQRKHGFSHKVPFGVGSFNIRKIGTGSQGTLCVCTWSSARCELLPEYEQLFLAYSDDISVLTKYAQILVYDRTADDIFILNSLNLATLLKKEPNNIVSLAESLPPWILVYTVSGFGILPDEQIKYKKILIQDRNIPMLDSIPGITAEEVKVLIRNSSDEPYWKLRLKGDVRDLFFLSSLDKVPIFINLMEELAREENYPISDLGVYIQPDKQGIHCHVELNFNFDPTNEAEAELLKNFMQSASLKLFSAGAYFSRPYEITNDMVFSAYSDLVPLLRQIKTLLDPKDVLNPNRLCFAGAYK